ncbi:hypothetical protein GVAV_003078 [Gurleya vavrai]
MGRKKIKEDVSTSFTEISESKEISQEDMEEEDRDREKIFEELICIERQKIMDQHRMAIENERQECIINSFFMYTPKKREKIKENDAEIEMDIEIITAFL